MSIDLVSEVLFHTGTTKQLFRASSATRTFCYETFRYIVADELQSVFNIIS